MGRDTITVRADGGTGFLLELLELAGCKPEPTEDEKAHVMVAPPATPPPIAEGWEGSRLECMVLFGRWLERFKHSNADEHRKLWFVLYGLANMRDFRPRVGVVGGGPYLDISDATPVGASVEAEHGGKHKR